MATIEWREISKSENFYTMVVYSEKDKIYSTVGYNINSKIYFISNSIDGITWKNSLVIDYPSGITLGITGIISYIKETQTYIAFLPNPSDTQNTDCYTSGNGTAWTYQSTIYDFAAGYSIGEGIYNPTVVYSSVSNIYMGILLKFIDDIASSYLITSNDGKNWNTNNSLNDFIISLPNVAITSIQYNNINNSFLACLFPQANINGFIMASYDSGNTWSISLETTIAITQIICTDSVITCLGFDNKNSYSYTSNPSNYEWVKNKSFANYPILTYQISYNNNIFLASGLGTDNNFYSLTSIDSINWISNKFEISQSSYLFYAYSPDTNNYLIPGVSEKGTSFFRGIVSLEPICVPAGTPIFTDQGTFPIEKLDSQIHTIAKKRIIAITQTITPEQNLVAFEKGCLGINCPSQLTLMTPGHEVLHKGRLIQAKHFVNKIKGVYTVPYNGDILYNVLQERHGLMLVNNMTLETLNPRNKIAQSILKNIN